MATFVTYRRSAPGSLPGSDRLYLNQELGKIERATTSLVEAVDYDGLPTTDTPVAGTVAGLGSIPAQKLFRTRPAGPHTTTARAAFAIETQPYGSGQDGPGATDAAFYVINAKQNWTTTLQAGQLDGIVVHVRQGGPPTASIGDPLSSDCSAYGADVRAIKHTGAITQYEGLSYEIDTDGVTVLRTMDQVYGLISTTTSGTTAIGYRSTMMTGQGDYAFLSQELSGPAQWTNHYSAITLSGGTVYNVAWNGDTTVRSLTPTVKPDVAASIDCHGATVTIANGGNALLASGTGGLLTVREATTTGLHSVWLLSGGAPILIASVGAEWVAATTTPAAGHMSVAFDGTTGYRIYNNRGAAADFSVCMVQV